jgi:1-acyl-sn-glycerol-3-phosphate acyltransferase
VIPWFVALTVIFGTAAILSSYVMTPRKAAFNGVFWARLTAYAAFMRMRVIGRGNIDPSQSYVIVVNHQSAMDIIALYGWLGIDFRWVMKQEIRKVPFLGYACYRVGHVYIDRKNQAAAIQSLEAAKERIHSGTSVLFFPEGTRTESSALKPFKKGAFKMALDLGLPILPITLSGTDHVMPTKTLDLMPGQVDLTIHKAISTEGMTEEDIEQLMQESFTAINSALPEQEASSAGAIA